MARWLNNTRRPGHRWVATAQNGLVSVALGAVPFIVVGAIWYVAAESGRWSGVSVPHPERVFGELATIGTGGMLDAHLIASITRLSLGFLIAVSMGFVLGILMGLSRLATDILDPIVTFMNAISGVAWIPLAIVWFGLGQQAVLFILWNSIFFMVLLNTVLGVRTADKKLEEAAQTMGASRLRRIVTVTIPSALPNILTGVRLGHAFGWRALIAAEMIGATAGIGFLIFQSSSHGLSYRVFAGIIVIGVTVLLIDRVVLDTIERRTVRRWGMVDQPT